MFCCSLRVCLCWLRWVLFLLGLGLIYFVCCLFGGACYWICYLILLLYMFMFGLFVTCLMQLVGLFWLRYWLCCYSCLLTCCFDDWICCLIVAWFALFISLDWLVVSLICWMACVFSWFVCLNSWFYICWFCVCDYGF